jgi:hypothetical protein
MNYDVLKALVDAKFAAAHKAQTRDQQLDKAATEELLDFVHGVDGGAALVCAAARDALADAATAAEAAAAVPGEDAGEAVTALRLLREKAVFADQFRLPHEKRGRTRVDASQVEDLFKPAPASTMLLSLLSSLLLPVIIFLLLMLLLHSCSSSQAGRTH